MPSHLNTPGMLTFFFLFPQTNLKPLPFSDPSSPFAKKEKEKKKEGKNAAERMKT